MRDPVRRGAGPSPSAWSLTWVSRRRSNAVPRSGNRGTEPAAPQWRLRPLVRWSGLIVGFLLGAAAHPREAVFALTDDGGAPLGDAVVVLSSDAAPPPNASAAPQATMAQQNQAFVPGLLVVQRGASVSFPNRDATQHHVYSFSAARIFELPLYAGDTAPAVRFDTAGDVVLGCNIHDAMRGYIYVADSPYFAVSDARGNARIDGLPPGPLTLTIWHPRAREPYPPEPLVTAGVIGVIERRLVLIPPPPPVVRGLKAWTGG